MENGKKEQRLAEARQKMRTRNYTKEQRRKWHRAWYEKVKADPDKWARFWDRISRNKARRRKTAAGREERRLENKRYRDKKRLLFARDAAAYATHREACRARDNKPERRARKEAM